MSSSIALCHIPERQDLSVTLNLTSSVDWLAGELPGPACLPRSAGVTEMLSTTSLFTWECSRYSHSDATCKNECS